MIESLYVIYIDIFYKHTVINYRNRNNHNRTVAQLLYDNLLYYLLWNDD